MRLNPRGKTNLTAGQVVVDFFLRCKTMKATELSQKQDLKSRTPS